MIQIKRADGQSEYISARNVESIKEDTENKKVALLSMTSGRIIEVDISHMSLYDLIQLVTLEDNNENPR